MSRSFFFKLLLFLALTFPLWGLEKPNVILIICDDLNTDIAGYGGHPQALTPNMERLMDTGVAFKQAHCTIPICAPSRSSFLTGIYPHSSGNFAFAKWHDNEVLSNSYTLAGHFKNNGYYVLGAGKVMHNQYQREWTEFGRLADYGPYAFDGEQDVPHPMVPSPMRDDFDRIDGSFGPLIKLSGRDFGDGKSYSWRTGNWQGIYPLEFESESNRDPTADEYNGQWAVDKLKTFAAQPGDQPFFLAVGFMRPHTPLIVPQPYFDQYPLETLELPVMLEGDADDTHLLASRGGSDRGQKLFNSLVASYDSRDEALKHFVQAYLACVTSVDDLIGAILDVVDGSRLKENTIIVLTSDHGWGNGPKDYLYKNAPWEESTRVPLIIRAPGMAVDGASVDHPISLIDLYPTLVDLCGLPPENRRNEKGAPLDGFSLKPFLTHPQRTAWEGPDAALTAVLQWGKTEASDQIFTLRSKEWRYIRYPSGDEELYHNTVDPHEWSNLADDPEHAATIDRFRAQLNARLGL